MATGTQSSERYLEFIISSSEKESYVRWDKGRLIALVIVSRTVLAKIGTTRIEWEDGLIEFLWHQERKSVSPQDSCQRIDSL